MGICRGCKWLSSFAGYFCLLKNKHIDWSDDGCIFYSLMGPCISCDNYVKCFLKGELKEGPCTKYIKQRFDRDRWIDDYEKTSSNS